MTRAPKKPTLDSAVGVCPNCGRTMRLIGDGRLRKHHRSETDKRTCPGWGELAVGHPTQPAREGEPPAE